jgi:hypothetical protein
VLVHHKQKQGKVTEPATKRQRGSASVATVASRFKHNTSYLKWLKLKQAENTNWLDFLEEVDEDLYLNLLRRFVNVQIAEPPKELRHIDVPDEVFKSTINICGIKYRTLQPFIRWGDLAVYPQRIYDWMDLYVAAKKNGIKVDVQAWSMADLWKALTSL